MYLKCKAIIGCFPGGGGGWSWVLPIGASWVLPIGASHRCFTSHVRQWDKCFDIFRSSSKSERVSQREKRKENERNPFLRDFGKDLKRSKYQCNWVMWLFCAAQEALGSIVCPSTLAKQILPQFNKCV